jgi:hypothetical protein
VDLKQRVEQVTSRQVDPDDNLQRLRAAPSADHISGQWIIVGRVDAEVLAVGG